MDDPCLEYQIYNDTGLEYLIFHFFPLLIQDQGIHIFHGVLVR